MGGGGPKGSDTSSFGEERKVAELLAESILRGFTSRERGEGGTGGGLTRGGENVRPLEKNPGSRLMHIKRAEEGRGTPGEGLGSG